MTEEVDNAPKLKHLDLINEKSFTANGNKYFVSTQISIARWKEFQKLEPRLTIGTDMMGIFKQVRSAYDKLNTKEGKVADAAVTLYNIMSGIKGIDDSTREEPALLMAALVINKEGEDIGTYDEAVQLEKISEWKKEGYDMLHFFTFALSSIQGFRETYLEFIAQEIIKSKLQNY